MLTNDQMSKLKEMYTQKLGLATQIYRKDVEERGNNRIEKSNKKSRILF